MGQIAFQISILYSRIRNSYTPPLSFSQLSFYSGLDPAMELVPKLLAHQITTTVYTHVLTAGILNGDVHIKARPLHLFTSDHLQWTWEIIGILVDGEDDTENDADDESSDNESDATVAEDGVLLVSLD